MRKRSPTAHLYRHSNVTLDNLESFAVAPRGEQVKILAELRKRASDDSHTIELAIVGIAATLIATLVVPDHVDLSGLPLIGALIAGGLLGIVAVLVLIPLLITTAVRSNRREAAMVWLRAYEDELQHWQGLPGRAGRKWRARQ